MTAEFISKDGKTNADPFSVQAAVKRRVGSLAALARRHNLAQSTVQTAIYRCQPAGNRIIADLLEVPVHRIWPEWFNRAGNVIPDGKTRTTDDGARTHQKGAAA